MLTLHVETQSKKLPPRSRPFAKQRSAVQPRIAYRISPPGLKPYLRQRMGLTTAAHPVDRVARSIVQGRNTPLPRLDPSYACLPLRLLLLFRP
jgi:hypothetical protein